MDTSYEECIKACQECMEACNQCYSACLKEDNVKMMAGCIRMDRECAIFVLWHCKRCKATARL